MNTSGGEGKVTSGTFSPTLARSVALARLPVDIEKDGEVVIRIRRHPVRIVKPPFVRHGEIQVDL